jgi:uncharacterized protein (TIGR03382 family)
MLPSFRTVSFILFACLLQVGIATPAWACGCFAQQNIAVPVVQAGERIAFAQRGGDVEMHVQILYAGEAEEFGWLLPVPEQPQLSPGSDALFRVLLNQTQPIYQLNRSVDWNSCGDGNGGLRVSGEAGDAGFGAGAPQSDDGSAPPRSPLLSRELVGPYDAATLDGSNKEAMLEWLDDNGFSVADDPNDPVIDQYVGPGRKFLALKLRGDANSDEIQPLVLRFSAGAPSIPIKLTRVGAEPDMPILVWVLGEARAIPQNYRHTVLNPEHIDWFNNGQNYVDVVTQAVDEAPSAHSFVTEFSGATDPFRDQLAPEWRFGARAGLTEVDDAAAFVRALQERGFDFDPLLASILGRYIPYPEALRAEGVSQSQFYADLPFYLLSGVWSDLWRDAPLTVDGDAASAEIWERIVRPARQAEALFADFPRVTRLFTTLSPHEMTEDPVFAFNPDLPDVARRRVADFTQVCNGQGELDGFGWLQLPDGRRFYTRDDRWRDRPGPDVPFSSQIQALGLEGEPRIEVDNRSRVSPGDDPSAVGGDGCSAVPPSTWGAWALASAALGSWLRRRRRR